MLKTYEPKPIRGRLTIFRSTGEPAGRFLDPKLGWSGMAADGVDLMVVPGDHYTVFKEPGASIMAKYIEAAMRSDVADPGSDAVVFRPATISASSRLANYQEIKQAAGE